MNKLVPLLGLATVAMVFGTLALKPASAIGADDDSLWKPFLSADDFNKLVESEAKLIREELSKPKADAHKIKGSAILIALAAQNNKDASDPKQVGNEPVVAQQVADHRIPGAAHFLEQDRQVRAVLDLAHHRIQLEPRVDLLRNHQELLPGVEDAQVLVEACRHDLYQSERGSIDPIRT